MFFSSTHQWYFHSNNFSTARGKKVESKTNSQQKAPLCQVLMDNVPNYCLILFTHQTDRVRATWTSHCGSLSGWLLRRISTGRSPRLFGCGTFFSTSPSFTAALHHFTQDRYCAIGWCELPWVLYKGDSHQKQWAESGTAAEWAVTTPVPETFSHYREPLDSQLKF